MAAPSEKSEPDMPMAFSMPKTLALLVSSLHLLGRIDLLVQGGLVEVLQGLSDQKEGQEEHVDASSNAPVLLFGLSYQPCTLHTFDRVTYNLAHLLGLLVRRQTDVPALILLEDGLRDGLFIDMPDIGLFTVVCEFRRVGDGAI